MFVEKKFTVFEEFLLFASIVLYFKIQYSGTKTVISLKLGVRSGNILPDEQDKT
jgi:hypothetical protein